MKKMSLLLAAMFAVSSCAAMDGAAGGLIPAPEWHTAEFVIAGTGMLAMLEKAKLDHVFTINDLETAKVAAGVVQLLYTVSDKHPDCVV